MAKLYLGTKAITPMRNIGEQKAFNVDGYDWLGEINAQGVLVAPTKELNPIFDGVKTISSSILRSKFKNDNRVKSVGFPDLETLSGSLEESFYLCPITEINFPKLKTISSSNTLCSTFSGCPLTSISMPELETVSGSLVLSRTFASTQIESVSFPKLTSASGHQVMAGLFYNCQKLKRAYFPALEFIDSDDSTNFAFYGCGLLEYVDLSSLSKIGLAGLCQFFQNCTSLKTVLFSALEEIEAGGMTSCFYNCGIETLSFPELVKINSDYSFGQMCSNCSSLTSISFPKLATIENTSGYNDCFEDMLYGCSNVTVHFPSALEATIGNWSDVLGGFGGTNTTVLFDL